MSLALRQLALACVVACVLPQVVAVAGAVHVLLDHRREHDHAGPIVAMPAALHGHEHEASTPGHDHPLTAPVARNVAFHPQPALPVAGIEAYASSLPVDASTTGARFASWRPAPVNPTVLRI